MNQKLEPAKVVKFLQKELRWQLDYDRGGVFKDNQTSGLFFFICIYHENLKTPLALWAYTMFYYPKKETQFSCKCGVEFKDVYEIWSKEKKVDLETAVKEVDYLFENSNFEDDFIQLPQFKPSYNHYKIKDKLIKKNVYDENNGKTNENKLDISPKKQNEQTTKLQS